jgi:ABC-type sulfate transport system permease component
MTDYKDPRDVRNHRESERDCLGARLLAGFAEIIRCSVVIFLLMVAWVVVWDNLPGAKSVDEILGIDPPEVVAGVAP